MSWTISEKQRTVEWAEGLIGIQVERENAVHCLNMAARLGRIMLNELGVTEATLDRFDELLTKEPDIRLAARAGAQIAALRILMLTGAPEQDQAQSQAQPQPVEVRRL